MHQTLIPDYSLRTLVKTHLHFKNFYSTSMFTMSCYILPCTNVTVPVPSLKCLYPITEALVVPICGSQLSSDPFPNGLIYFPAYFDPRNPSCEYLYGCCQWTFRLQFSQCLFVCLFIYPPHAVRCLRLPRQFHWLRSWPGGTRTRNTMPLQAPGTECNVGRWHAPPARKQAILLWEDLLGRSPHTNKSLLFG